MIMKRSHPDPALAGEACLPAGRDPFILSHEHAPTNNNDVLNYSTA
jgi:hypothetical protein